MAMICKQPRADDGAPATGGPWPNTRASGGRIMNGALEIARWLAARIDHGGESQRPLPIASSRSRTSPRFASSGCPRQSAPGWLENLRRAGLYLAGERSLCISGGGTRMVTA
jgi:hypothetical protein